MANDLPAILQVLPSLYSGGVERGTVDIAEAIQSQGWMSIVASGGGPIANEVLRVGAMHIKLGLNTRNPFLYWRNSNALVDLIREKDVKIIHARSRAPAWGALRAAKITGIPLVTTFHGTYGTENALKRWYNSVMLRGDKVIAISNFIARHIEENYQNFDASKLIIIPRGVDLVAFDPSSIASSRIIKLSQKWRIPDGIPIIMFPARFARWKGHQILIDALAKMKTKEFLCLIIGRNDNHYSYFRQLEKLVDKLNLETKVRFINHESDMPAAYMLADVVVSASTNPEAFGRVSAEAQAMGRPVIASDHGGSKETIVSGKTGWLIKPGDDVSLASALDEALGLDRWKREIMAARATKHIFNNFNLTKMRRDTIEVYRDLIKE